jgi:glyoxylase-like metal-dependent hydrolase (beta-lactamase superfamily II)
VRTTYDHGLREVAEGLFAYLQPNGQWGFSNAGLVTAEDRSLLVDTLFDLKLTRRMLDEMAPHTSKRPISTVVNTHANGDHCWGNQLVSQAEIIASRKCAEEMREVDPAMFAGFIRMEGLGQLGDYLKRIFGAFDFDGITVTPPTKTFEKELEIEIGTRIVELIEVGPAHTAGDVIVWLPRERVLFTGDILFIEGTPIVWAGPIENWIRACDRILALDASVIVPGHGPLTDAAGVRAVREYLRYVSDEATKRFEAGMSVGDAVRDIALGAFSGWRDKERLAVNVNSRYRELAPSGAIKSVPELFAEMAKLA